MSTAVARRLGKALVITGVVMATLVAVLVATPVGTAILVGVVRQSAGESIVLDAVTGTLASELTVGSVRLAAGAETITASDAVIDVALARLLRGELRIDSLTAKDISITTGTATDGADTEPAAAVVAPLPITIARIELPAIRISTGERTESLAVAGALAWRDTTLSLDAVDIRHAMGRLSATASLSTSPDGPLAVNLNWFLTDAARPAEGRLVIDGPLGALSVAHTLVAPLALSTTGTVAIGDQLSVELMHEWPAQSLAPVGVAGIGTQGGSLVTQGTAADLAWSVETALVRGDALTTRVAGNGTASSDVLRITALTITDPAGTVGVAGSARLAGGAWELAADIDAVLAGVPDAGVAFPEPVAATGRLAAAISSSGEIHGELVLPPTANTSAELSGRVELRDTVVVVEQLMARVGNDDISVGGQANSGAIDFQSRLQVADLARYRPAWGGSVEADVTVRGRPAAPAITATFSGDELVIDATTVAELSGAVSVDADANGTGTVSVTGLSLGERAAGDWQLRVAGNPATHRWRLDGAHTDLTVAAEAAGGFAQSVYRLSWNGFDVRAPQYGDWQLQQPAGDWVFSDTAIQLGRFCLSGSGSACGDAEIDTVAQRGNATLDVARLPIAELARWLSASLRLDGYLDVDMAADWSGNDIRARSHLEVQEGRLRAPDEDGVVAAELGFTAAADATIAGSRLTLSGSLNAPDAGDIRLSGWHANVFSEAAGFEAEGRIAIPDVTVLDPWIRAAAIMQGAAGLEVSASGSVAEPDVVAELAVTDFAASVASTGTDIGDISARIESSGDRRWKIESSAALGTGEMRAAGELRWPVPGGWEGRIDIDGSTLTLADSAEFALQVTPALRIARSAERMVIGGELTIPAATLRPIDVPAEAQLPSQDVVIHGAANPTVTAPSLPTELDLTLRLGDAVYLDGYGLAARLTGSIRAAGELPDNWRTFGSLRLTDGTFEAYGQELAIERGELLFAGDPLNPGLNVVATRQVEPGSVGIIVQGTVRTPSSSLTSTPQLPDAEALAWLDHRPRS